MSSVNIQKHLPCHDYHMGNCPLPKQQCPYSHLGQSWGICPNKTYCPTPHKLVDCPLFALNKCPKGDACYFRHQNKSDQQNQNKVSLSSSSSINNEKKSEDKLIQEDSQTQSSQNESKSAQPKKKQLTIEDFNQNLQELHQDLKLVESHTYNTEEIRRSVHQGQGMDLCFIVDITGSMGTFMNTVKNYMRTTIQTILEEHPDFYLRVAFSGYRDFGNQDQYVVINFTDSLDDFNSQIYNVHCAGGGDGDLTEDVCGGLYNALQLSWASKTKQVIFMADYPCHGSVYHDSTIPDNYPKGDPNGRKLEDLMRQFSCKQVKFTCIELSSDTKIMFGIMRTVYGQNLQIRSTSSPMYSNPANKNAPNQSKNSLANVLHESISQTISQSGFSTNNTGTNKPQATTKGSIQQALGLVIQNKRYSSGFSYTKSRERKGTLIGDFKEQLEAENKVLHEEEEYDSDDSDYEERIEKECKKQKANDIKEKKEEEKKKQEERLQQLKLQFPSHYFETVEQNFERNSKRKNVSKEQNNQKVTYTSGKLRWDHFESSFEYQAVCYSFELVKNMKAEVNWQNLDIQTFILGTKVRISTSVFSEGAMRYAYQAKDLYLKQNMVAKQYKRIVKQNSSNVESMKRDILSQIVCKYIVKEFNSKILEAEGCNSFDLFHFIDCYIYEMTYPYTSNKFYYFEKYIEGNYEKFNNNAGYVSSSQNSYNLLAQALSHFSWQLSKGYLAIVDLQGNTEGVLTDPQVHCLDKEKFGDGNLGYEGILRFFASHKCNNYCKKLQLINPFEQSKIPIGSMLIDNTLLSNSNQQDPNNKIPQLCDICSNLQSFTVKQYMHCKKNDEKLICKGCQFQISKTKIEKKCLTCSNCFSYSTFECIQLRRDAPSICKSCNINSF